MQLVMHYQPRKAWVTNMLLNTIYFADVPDPSAWSVKLSQLQSLSSNSSVSPVPELQITQFLTKLQFLAVTRLQQSKFSPCHLKLKSFPSP